MSQQLLSTVPEAVGVPSAALLSFLDAVEEHCGGLHSLMLLRHGQIAAQGWWAPYGPDRAHRLFSLSKSFTATAVGLAIAEGRLTVEDRVLDYFPDEAPARVSRNLEAMQVHHLLSMNTGHAEDTLPRILRRRDGDWARAFLSAPVRHKPGSHFEYNSGASYMLSAIVQRLTGMPIVAYLQPRLFDRLGIAPPEWETCPRGVNAGGWGLYLKTEDIARFGQLYLQKGVWGGERLLPEAWVEQATRFQSDNSHREAPDWRQGYGYHFWLCRHGAYRGDGAFGQYCLVMPEQDAVLAITSGVRDMQAVLDQVWTHLLPAMGPGALPESPGANETLTERLGSLAIAPAQGQARSPLAAEVSGRWIMGEGAPGIRSIAFELQPEACILRMRDRVGLHTVTCGWGAWREGATTIEIGLSRIPARSAIERPVAGSAAWTDDRTLEVRLCYNTTPFRPTLTCRFDGDTARFCLASNVGWAEPLGVEWAGRRGR
jgi:CubicO group peptidase (beta-lactamase class C family)